MLLGRRVAIVFLLAANWNARWTIFAGAWVTTSPSRDNRNPMKNVATDVPLGSSSRFAPPATTWSCSSSSSSSSNNNRNRNRNTGSVAGNRNSCLHVSVVSPRRADVGGGIENDDGDNPEENLVEQQEKLTLLLELLDTEHSDLFRFDTGNDSNGLRGIYLDRSVEKGAIVLKLPVDSCFTDDRSPSWLHDDVRDDPHRWATRLAASWIDLHLAQKHIDDHESSSPWNTTTTESSSPRGGNATALFRGHALWCSLLPDPEYLRASLPVHWPETTLLTARSTALELAVDSAFFARAEAVDDLVRGMQRSPKANGLLSGLDEVDRHRFLNELAHQSLDLVQTRSCRLDDEPIGSKDEPCCRRALAPIFDFINHGSTNTGAANAYFALEVDNNQEREYLVVRALQDLSRDEEVKLDYGASARPAWKCLLSYGFVPEYKRTTNGEGGENLAEVYMKGVRYEVADDSVPMDMVEDATPRPRVDKDDETDLPSNENLLTPDIALRIAERIADAAYYLLLEPEQILDENDNTHEQPEDEDDATTPFEVISKQLAASLRWSQHRILLTCAAGLTHHAKEHKKAEESSYQ